RAAPAAPAPVPPGPAPVPCGPAAVGTAGPGPPGVPGPAVGAPRVPGPGHGLTARPGGMIIPPGASAVVNIMLRHDVGPCSRRLLHRAGPFGKYSAGSAWFTVGCRPIACTPPACAPSDIGSWLCGAPATLAAVTTPSTRNARRL